MIFTTYLWFTSKLYTSDINKLKIVYNGLLVPWKKWYKFLNFI